MQRNLKSLSRSCSVKKQSESISKIFTRGYFRHTNKGVLKKIDMSTIKIVSISSSIVFVIVFLFLFSKNKIVDSSETAYEYGSLNQKIEFAVTENLFDNSGLSLNHISNQCIEIITDNGYNIYYYAVEDNNSSPYAEISKKKDEYEIEIKFYSKVNRVELTGDNYSYWFYCDDSLNVKSEHYFLVPIEDGGQKSKNDILSVVNENTIVEMIDFYYSFTNDTIEDLYANDID